MQNYKPHPTFDSLEAYQDDERSKILIMDFKEFVADYIAEAKKQKKAIAYTAGPSGGQLGYTLEYPVQVASSSPNIGGSAALMTLVRTKKKDDAEFDFSEFIRTVADPNLASMAEIKLRNLLLRQGYDAISARKIDKKDGADSAYAIFIPETIATISEVEFFIGFKSDVEAQNAALKAQIDAANVAGNNKKPDILPEQELEYDSRWNNPDCGGCD